MILVISWKVAETDFEEKKLLNEDIIFVFFVHKNILVAGLFLRCPYTFLGLERVSCVAVYADTESSRIQ